MTEILEFNLLPKECLESSWGAVWLGIRMFVVFNGWIFIDFWMILWLFKDLVHDRNSRI